MNELNFKPLTPEQIEVRPTDTKYKGKCTLLLYIDSRSAAEILNETVGVMNWQLEYKDVAGQIYGRLSIFDETRGIWIYKEDTGEESNISEKKGQSSDILKRCLARWGCDYLYHTPRIKVNCPESYYFNDKLTMTFSVRQIEFVGKECTRLVIVDRFGNTVYDWSNGKEAAPSFQNTSSTNTSRPAFEFRIMENPLDDRGMLQKQLYLDIVKSQDTDKLKKIYDSYPNLHNHKIFLDTLTKRRTELQNAV